MTALALACFGPAAKAGKSNPLASHNPAAPRNPRRIASRREMGLTPKIEITPLECCFANRLLEGRFIPIKDALLAETLHYFKAACDVHPVIFPNRFHVPVRLFLLTACSNPSLRASPACSPLPNFCPICDKSLLHRITV
jgi:hypothetical protein